jgi:polyisoprenyl-teichoic acid--peptidoglycan teichoic acid transferase
MGKHSTGGSFGSGGGRGSGRGRLPAERLLTSDNSTPLQDATRRPGVESAPARLRAERDRRRGRTRSIILAVLAVLVVLVVIGVVALGAWAQSLQSNMTIKNKEKLQVELAKAQPSKPYNILLLGADFRKGDTAYRTDTIIVARIDPQTKKIWLLSIPRDTKVLIPGHGYQKINAAHAFGGPELTVRTVTQFTGLPINHYMEVNFQGFQKAVNQMGGVWMNVPKAINDKRAASQSVHQRAAKISAGWQRLDGEHALTYVRSREAYADQDIGRMGAQQLFFRAIAEQLAKRTDVPTMIKVVNGISPYIQTDLSLMDMMGTALALKDAGSKNMYTATVGGEWVSPFIVSDEAKLHVLVENIKNSEPFNKGANASNVPNPTPSAPTSGTSATAATVKNPKAVKITVRNGAGVSGYGAQAASILKAKGFTVKGVGNANQNVYITTLVVYKTDLAAANAVAATLIPGTKVVKSRGLYSSPTEILVVVGKDWDISQIPAATVTTQ